jgi:hypothetical protein
MNPKVEEVFRLWLTLNENEKTDFIKELLYYNKLSPAEQIAHVKSLDKTSNK